MNQDRSLPRANIGWVLILEDEAMVAMAMEDAVRELGADRIDVCGDVGSALAAAATGDYDCAILDVLLDGRTSTGVADLLAERGVPFMFSSGSTEAALEPRHRSYPMLAKPYADDDLKACILGVVTQSRIELGAGGFSGLGSASV